MERYKTIAGEEIVYETPAPEVARFLSRVVSAANDPRVSESELVDLIYGTENPIMKQGVIPGRGVVTKEVFANPVYQIMSDLIGVKQVQLGTLDPERDFAAYTLTVNEAAERLGIHPSAVRQAIHQHRLDAIKKGGIHLLKPSSVDSYRVSRRGRVPGHLKPVTGERATTKRPALTVCVGNNERGSFRLRPVGGAIEVTGRKGHEVDGVIQSFEKAAVISGGKGDYRFFELEPANEENALEMGPFYVRGHFKIVEKENNPRRANEKWRAFKADTEAAEGQGKK